MRNYKTLLLTAIAAIFLYACTQKESQVNSSETTDPNEWPQMDSFHMIMSESFHPYKDSANLEPVKRLADEMANEAEKWAGTALPEKVNTEEMKAMIQQLKSDTRALADNIKNGASDEAIGNALNALHDSFHGIMEGWNGANGEKHEHQH
jgi:hypothetical protein